MSVAYDGTAYSGWQRQNQGEATVQATLEGCLAVICGHPVTLHGAGRTDAGVHALGQVASVRLSDSRTPGEIIDYVNRYLPEDIGVLRVEEAPPRFHARLTPSRKTYRYRIWASPLPCVFERRWCCCPERIPDAGKMAEAAPLFLGKHDFAAFHSGKTKKSTVRTIHEIAVEPVGPELHITVTGDGFLYNMVRIIAGTLLEIGWGEREAASIPEALASGDRALAGFTAPPQGLCLMEVNYL